MILARETWHSMKIQRIRGSGYYYKFDFVALLIELPSRRQQPNWLDFLKVTKNCSSLIGYLAERANFFSKHFSLKHIKHQEHRAYMLQPHSIFLVLIISAWCKILLTIIPITEKVQFQYQPTTLCCRNSFIFIWGHKDEIKHRVKAANMTHVSHMSTWVIYL